MSEGAFPLRASARGPGPFCRMGPICVTHISGIGRMLFGRTLRFTAKTRKRSQQHPWHCDCYLRAGKRLVTCLLSLEGCGKTIVVRENFDGPHVWHNRRTPRRIAARQAEVEAKAEAQMRTVRSLLSLNLNLSLLQAGGLFQHPVRRGVGMASWSWAPA